MATWAAYQRHAPAERQVRRWWARWPGAALGLVTGAISDRVVVDVDTREPAALDLVLHRFGKTPLTVRTRRGWHAHYRHPGGHVPNGAKLAGFNFDVGVRGDGGYVLVPPSRSYTWSGDPAADLLPVFPAMERPTWSDHEPVAYERRDLDAGALLAQRAAPVPPR